ncbi:MAG: imidazoleglycerol-phosphate dehydratase HisB [Clostridiales bacterium]|nr:imidazoleglycerol-phosphate dehydratase HisB [Clostridiales bacterium]
MRKEILERNTNETKVKAVINLDEKAENRIDTGIGFFDHMLNLFAFRAGITLKIACTGDLDVDGHHTVEDVGICLGQVISKALGDKNGIARYGSARLPMDECLAQVDIDISNRPYLVFNAVFSDRQIGESDKYRVGGFEVELVEEFFRAVAVNAGMTLHINLLYGKNTHHKIEAIFKAFGAALGQAIKTAGDAVPSTKGVM